MRLSVLPVLALLIATPLSAQGTGVQLSIEVPVVAGQPVTGPTITTANLLRDADTRELLRNGFPAELHYKVELWRKSGWFDDLEGSTEWLVLVSYDPASKLYKVVRRHGNQLEDFGGFQTVTSAEAPIGRAYPVSLRPRRSGGRYYYTLSLDVQALSVSDLDELQRWLHGDLQPAVRGRNSVGNALKSGLGTLLSRVLGGEQKHYDARSPTFVAP